MTRSQSAYLRAIKAALTNRGKIEKFDAGLALELYDLWVKAPEAAAILADKKAKLLPVTIKQAGQLLANAS